MNKIAALITIKNLFINEGIEKIVGGIKNNSSLISVFNINEITATSAKKIIQEFEILIFDDYILNIKYMEPKRKKFLIEDWKGIEFYENIIEVLMKARKKVLWMNHHDLHGSYIIDKQITEHSKDLFEHVIWFYEHQEKGKKNIPIQYVDDWMENYDDPIDNKNEIIEKFSSRIDLPFCITYPSEKKSKDKDVVVPGIRYRSRLIAEKSVKEYKYILRLSNYAYRDKLLTGCMLLSQRIPHVLAKKIIIFINSLRKKNYKKELGRAKTCWIDGSGYDYPVHKFFEAIETRTLIITPGLTGLKQYGFFPNVHYIECEPENFGKKAHEIVSKNENIIQILTTNAYQFASKMHSVEARVKQLESCMKAIKQNNFKAGLFKNGKFEVITR